MKKLGGDFTFPGTSLTVHRMGYGAMQLAGPGVWGPPRDQEAAAAVLREAIERGVNHIDTSDFYGPHITNQMIRRALHPYPERLTIVTKVGNRRTENKAWPVALKAEELTSAVRENLKNLGLEELHIVNLRLGDMHGPNEASLAEPLGVLMGLQKKGMLRHIGLSNVSPKQVAEARALTKIVCVQNHYNFAHRSDDTLIDELALAKIAYVPFFPLGGFTKLQSAKLDAVASKISRTPMQVALAWLLHRSPNILLIPGTSSVKHLRENLEAAELALPDDAIAQLATI